MASSRLMMPALFTRMSIRPYAFSASLITVSITSVEERSAITVVNSPPISAILAAVSSHDLLATPTTLAPAAEF